MMGQVQAEAEGRGWGAGSLGDGGGAFCVKDMMDQAGIWSKTKTTPDEHHRGKDPEVRVSTAI